MQNTIVKYSIIFLLVLVYINRGLFIFAYEMENQGGGEINSVVEWVQQLVTGESNDIDEDGDMQTDCNFSQIQLYDFPQQFAQIKVFTKEIKKDKFPYTENFLSSNFCSKIDQPPEV